MNQPKTYFLAPDFDCPPDTAIKLGHIITSPHHPYDSLNSDTLLPIPSSLLITTSKTGFAATRSQIRSGKYGIWAQILEGAFGGAGVGFNHEKSEDGEIACDEVETTFMKPAGAEVKEYLKKSLEDEGVKAFFEGSRFKKSVFMIVGLKIARGARVSSGVKRSRGGEAKVMVDGTAAGLPVSVGPHVEVKRGREEGVEWSHEHAFVFAYRLRRITCKKGKMVGDEAFNKGAFLDLEGRAEGQEPELHYLVEEEDTGITPDGEDLESTVVDEEEVVLHPGLRD